MVKRISNVEFSQEGGTIQVKVNNQVVCSGQGIDFYELTKLKRCNEINITVDGSVTDYNLVGNVIRELGRSKVLGSLNINVTTAEEQQDPTEKLSADVTAALVANPRLTNCSLKVNDAECIPELPQAYDVSATDDSNVEDAIDTFEVLQRNKKYKTVEDRLHINSIILAASSIGSFIFAFSWFIQTYYKIAQARIHSHYGGSTSWLDHGLQGGSKALVILFATALVALVASAIIQSKFVKKFQKLKDKYKTPSETQLLGQDLQNFKEVNHKLTGKNEREVILFDADAPTEEDQSVEAKDYSSSYQVWDQKEGWVDIRPQEGTGSVMDVLEKHKNETILWTGSASKIKCFRKFTESGANSGPHKRAFEQHQMSGEAGGGTGKYQKL